MALGPDGFESNHWTWNDLSAGHMGPGNRRDISFDSDSEARMVLTFPTDKPRMPQTII
jgi:hypothetical protein